MCISHNQLSDDLAFLHLRQPLSLLHLGKWGLWVVWCNSDEISHCCIWGNGGFGSMVQQWWGKCKVQRGGKSSLTGLGNTLGLWLYGGGHQSCHWGVGVVYAESSVVVPRGTVKEFQQEGDVSKCWIRWLGETILFILGNCAIFLISEIKNNRFNLTTLIA